MTFILYLFYFYFFRNRVRSKEERKDAILKKKEAAKRAQGIFPKSELQSINDRRKHEELRKLNSTKDKFDMDIWNSGLFADYFSVLY